MKGHWTLKVASAIVRAAASAPKISMPDIDNVVMVELFDSRLRTFGGAHITSLIPKALLLQWCILTGDASSPQPS